MSGLHHFIRVDFTRFKALRSFSLHLRQLNILVGPNNAGKSTILAAFRILAVGLRKANIRKAELVIGPNGPVHGYTVDLSSVSVAEENIYYNYDDSQNTSIEFTLSNRNKLVLFFESGKCYLIAEAKRPCPTPALFKNEFNCPIGFSPILGPVDHNELLFDKEAARRALFNFTAARNFRNIWYHYPESFEEFRSTLNRTWPGMDVEKPSLDYTSGKPKLYMMCPEERIPREIFWSGFGFQVWCQMLTHLIQSKERSLFLIDEPDIYLHSDLQRQLLGLLRDLGPDILIATHSTEIITEAEPDDIVLIDKSKQNARRIKSSSQLTDVFTLLGSKLNPILTQLARTRRAVFVEGQDFQILGRFAQKLGVARVSSRANFAVIPIEGFNPQRIRNLILGMETTLGSKVQAAAIMDRDYRSDAEREAIKEECLTFCNMVIIHKSKEIENLLLVPDAINRAAERKVADRVKRSGKQAHFLSIARELLEKFCIEKKEYVMAQHLASRQRFERSSGRRTHDATCNEKAIKEFNVYWQDFVSRISLIPGKEAINYINQQFQAKHTIGVTPGAIIDAMKSDEIPQEVQNLIGLLDSFAQGGSAE